MNTIKSLKELEAEAKELEQQIKALRKAEKIREGSAKKIEKTTRLLIDLKNVNLPCISELRNALEVVTIFKSSLCQKENCMHYDTCKSIVDLQKKSSTGTGTGKTRLATANLKKTFDSKKRILTITINDDMITNIPVGKNWEEYKINLKKTYSKERALLDGLTVGQYQGLQHRTTMERILKF